MKRKNDFTEGSIANHDIPRLSSMMQFVSKLLLLTLVVLMLASSFIALEVSADPVEETFEYSGVRELQVDGMFFTVEVSGYTGDVVEGLIRIPQKLYERNFVEVMHSKSGGVLKVEVKKKRAIIPPVSEKSLLSIRVPRDITITLMTFSGNITAEGFETDKILLKSSSGKIKAKDLDASIDIASSSGSQDIQQCRGPLDIQSSSGSVSVRDVAGDISAESSSGGQRYEVIDGNIEAKSSSGSITINEQTGTLDLRATSGRLVGRDILLTGDSSFHTSSGKISFEFENDFDDFSFNLQSSSGVLRVGESKVKGTFKVGNGPIKITGESSSGSQEYR
jgi:hypothetical protein